MNNPILIAIVSWFLPGAGHVIQGRPVRGALIAGVVWLMFAIAIASGGAHYPGFEFKDGSLLYLLNIFARLGNGLGALVSFIMAGTPSPQVAALATFEYGGRFLEVAGLLNYLAAIDAADIAAGRKKMIHFLYLVGFALFVSIVFATISEGTTKDRILYGLKSFAQFIVVSLVLAWILYFIPW